MVNEPCSSVFPDTNRDGLFSGGEGFGEGTDQEGFSGTKKSFQVCCHAVVSACHLTKRKELYTSVNSKRHQCRRDRWRNPHAPFLKN